MILRRQLPVYSPISLTSLLSGWGSMVSGSSDRARTTVTSAITAEFAADEILLTDSGTSALTLAIRGICEARGERLIALPAYGCYDLATAADGAGVEVALYDVDAHTLGPDLESLTSVLRRRPAALVVAHLYGVPVDMDAVTQAAEKWDVVVIEDAAQGHGAVFDGAPLGSFGSLAILSFGRGKGMTGGGGGALLSHDRLGSEIVKRSAAVIHPASRGIRELFAATAQWVLARPPIYGLPASIPFLNLGKTVYRKPHPAAAISNPACNVLAANWSLFAAEALTRREVGHRLTDTLAGCDAAESIAVPPRGQAGYLRFPVLVSEAAKRHFRSSVARRLGVMPGYPQSLVDLPGFGDRCVNHAERFPGARCLAARLFTLPTHGKLTAADLRWLEGWLHKIGNAV
ncbi:MAG: DegT/DnrJ/EryC1/StrS family aminotransferase [Gemmatimonadetes bacterium]|nr:DegT/DnrJ/EryC1/StrS family aminotransferase [Gemmatimonadota bacterium]